MNMPISELFIIALEAIKQQSQQITVGKLRWNSSDCAEYLRLKPKYFNQNIASKPDFPEPKRIKIGKGRGHPTWVMREVINWMEAQ
jgi:predicted DNA-binding transcriptional regulator AlpA